MLKNDKKTETATTQIHDLQETCRLSLGLATPRMLRVVAEVLSPEKSTTVQLIEAIDKAGLLSSVRIRRP